MGVTALKVLSFITGPLVAFWLVAASFMVTLSAPVTHLLADATVDASGTAHSHEYLVSIADATRAFALGDDGASIPQGSDERFAFTPEVIGHLLDVRAVFIAAVVFFWALTFVLIVVLALTLLFARRAKKSFASAAASLISSPPPLVNPTASEPLVASPFVASAAQIRRSFGLALIVAGCVPLALGIVFTLIGVLAFDALFTWMHGLFFAEGTWQFSWDSLLILALPPGFWMGCAAVWAVSLAFFCLLGIVAGMVIRRRATIRYGRPRPR